MTSIPQVAEAMQTILTEVATAAARKTAFIQRERALTGAQFVQTLVFGWLDNPDATYTDLVAMAADLGVTITAQGLCDRFNARAAACMEQVLPAGLAQLVAADPVALPLLARFPAVLLHDSTSISLPDGLADHFCGCGGSRGRVAAAVKLHLRLELRTGHLEGPLFQDGRASDRGLAFRQRPAPGALVIRDLGFFQLDELATDQRDGRQWLSRLKANTAVFSATGVRLDLFTLLHRHCATTLDLPVQIGAAQHIPCRLLAVRVPQEVADQRRRRLRKDARDKGQTVSAARLALCEWTIAVTTIPAGQLTLQEAWVLLGVRWQIELVIKLWKSHGHIDETRGFRPMRVLTELYAKILGMLIQHWLLLTSCWRAPDRSLPKAAKVVRRMARGLALAVHAGETTLIATLTQLHEQLRRAGRQTPRRKDPNTYQLLQNPSLLSLT